MGLMFDDANEVVCPECGSHYYYEREEYLLDKNQKSPYDISYMETGRRYAIRCAECNKLISSTSTPKIVKLI